MIIERHDLVKLKDFESCFPMQAARSFSFDFHSSIVGYVTIYYRSTLLEVIRVYHPCKQIILFASEKDAMLEKIKYPDSFIPVQECEQLYLKRVSIWK